MANELAVSRTSGQTVYAVLISPYGGASGHFWRHALSQFEAFSGPNWADYKVTMTEAGTTGLFFGDMPDLRGQERIEVVYFQQAGGSPAMTDTKIIASRYVLDRGLWIVEEPLSV